MFKLSRLNRQEQLEQLSKRGIDLLVVGAGHIGAGIALDASLRGLNVLLIDRNDFANGFSSRSSKIINGGLQYLLRKEEDISKELSAEKVKLHKLAPHLVVPIEMSMPLYEDSSPGRFKMKRVLKKYDLYAGISGDNKYKVQRSSKFLETHPGLNTDGLIGGANFREYITDDSRLCMELVKSSVKHGAKAFNYTSVVKFEHEHGCISQAFLKDELDGEIYGVKVLHVVNASGAWVDRVEEKDSSTVETMNMIRVKSTHLVFPRNVLPLDKYMTFFDEHNHLMHIVPKGNYVYVGANERVYKSKPDKYVPSPEDANYICRTLNKHFDGLNLRPVDAVTAWSGLRSLADRGPFKYASDISKKELITQSNGDMISVIGGIPGAYRKIAQRVTDLVVVKHRRKTRLRLKDSITGHVQLDAGEFKSSKAVQSLINSLAATLNDNGRNPALSSELVMTYGTYSKNIVQKMIEFPELEELHALVKAELWYCVENEGVCTATDFFSRRTSRLFFKPSDVRSMREVVLDELTEYFDLDGNELASQMKGLDEAIAHTMTFKGGKLLTLF